MARPSRRLHVALWIAQVILALVFFVSGVVKLLLPLDELVRMIPAAPAWLMRWIGIAETFGAFGLVLPPRWPLQRALTVAAAIGLFTVMFLAAAAHLARGELFPIPINLALGALAAFVAWGRTTFAPPRRER